MTEWTIISKGCLNGWYSDGFALGCIDKRGFCFVLSDEFYVMVGAHLRIFLLKILANVE